MGKLKVNFVSVPFEGRLWLVGKLEQIFKYAEMRVKTEVGAKEAKREKNGLKCRKIGNSF